MVDITIHPEVRLHQVSRYLYGHFAEHLGRCIYGGIWVGEDSPIEHDGGLRLDTIRALKKLHLPALRWPGGCFADNYHWMDGIGPRDRRPRRHNLWWNQPETNQFGTDDFMRFCRLIDAEPYFCVNVGSGTVEEARAWVEYCNTAQSTTLARLRAENGNPDPYNIKLWGIGNENWGCGGMMRAQHYADLYRQFATYVQPTAGPGAKMIACGSHTGIGEWDEQFLDNMKGAFHLLDYLALHIYTGMGAGANSTTFTDDQYPAIIGGVSLMERHLRRTISLVQAYSNYGKKLGVVLDEWGTWFGDAVVDNGLYQQNTLQDALFTAASFHMFQSLGSDLFMTNMAQTVNVLQALVLTKAEKMILTPTYHVYEMFTPHRDGWLTHLKTDGVTPFKLPDGSTRDTLTASVTVTEDGNTLFISLVNLDINTEASVSLHLKGETKWKIVEARLLTAKDLSTHNTFEEPETVTPIPFKMALMNEACTLPARSIVTVRLTREG